MEITLSMIVPAYNAENDIRYCVDSILASTFRDFELILIDDGSTDSTGALCDALAQRDARVRVFHTENRGLPMARNLGLEKANGRFVGFVDADDLISKTMLEHLVCAMKADVGLAMCSFVRCARDSVQFRSETEACAIVISPSEATQKMLGSCGPYVWNRLYRKDLLDAYRIWFRQDAQGAEDLFFNAEYVSHCKSVAFIDIPLYAYIATERSITNAFRANRVVSKQYMSLPRASRYASDVLRDVSHTVAEEYRARATMYYQTVLRKLENPSDEYLHEALEYVHRNKSALLHHRWGWKYYCSALVLCADYRLWAGIFRKGIGRARGD